MVHPLLALTLTGSLVLPTATTVVPPEPVDLSTGSVPVVPPEMAEQLLAPDVEAPIVVVRPAAPDRSGVLLHRRVVNAEAKLAREKLAREKAAAEAAAAAAARAAAARVAPPVPVPRAAARLARSAAPTSYSGAAVFAAARRYLGVPYVFGGSSWSGMDCSGLVMRAFAAFGIYLPHSAMGEAARGAIVPRSQARLGDLVVVPGQHIAFWAGDGMQLEAARPGTVVRIHSIWSLNYYIVRIRR